MAADALQTRPYQELNDRRARQFACAARRFVGLVGDASANALLFDGADSRRSLPG